MKDFKDQSTTAEDAEPIEALRADLMKERLRTAGRLNLLEEGIPLEHLEALLVKCGYKGGKA